MAHAQLNDGGGTRHEDVDSRGCRIGCASGRHSVVYDVWHADPWMVSNWQDEANRGILDTEQVSVFSCAAWRK